MVGIDPTRANLAYLYDAFLDGKLTREIERETQTRLLDVCPDVGHLFTGEREFLRRVVRYLVGRDAGISQFVIAGAGLPERPGDNLHEIARRENRDVRVRYIEPDYLVATVGRALVDDEQRGVRVLETDPLAPAEMWHQLDQDAGLTRRQPVALLLGGVLSYHRGTRAEVAEIVQEHLQYLVPGSFLALTHLAAPDDPALSDLADRLQDRMRHSPILAGTFATYAEIDKMIAGTHPLDPGIVPVLAWWPPGPPRISSAGHLNVGVLVQVAGSADNAREGRDR